jgi:hypothetical protein
MIAEPGWAHYLHVVVHFVGQLVDGDPVAWGFLIVFVVVVVFAIRRDLRANRKPMRSVKANLESEEKGQP